MDIQALVPEWMPRLLAQMKASMGNVTADTSTTTCLVVVSTPVHAAPPQVHSPKVPERHSLPMLLAHTPLRGQIEHDGDSLTSIQDDDDRHSLDSALADR